MATVHCTVCNDAKCLTPDGCLSEIYKKNRVKFIIKLMGGAETEIKMKIKIEHTTHNNKKLFRNMKLNEL